jgi:Tfp pilus assembly protein PilN
LFGALVSKLLGYPLAPQDRDKYPWNDRWRAAVLLKIWPLAAVALVVGIVMLVAGA